MYNLIASKLVSLSRFSKNSLVMFSDYAMLVLAFWLSLSIRINNIYIPTEAALYLILFAPLIALPIFYFFGLYKSLIRYSSYKSLILIAWSISIYTILWFLIVMLAAIVIKPYDFLIINLLISIFLTGGIRYSARWFLISRGNKKSKVLIYGAGSAGLQLSSAIWYSNDIKVVGFIDDDKSIQGKYIDSLKVYSPKEIEKIIEKKDINEVIIAIPSLSKKGISVLINSLKQYSIIIRVLPSLIDLVKGRVSIADLKVINIEDLLQREVRLPNKDLLRCDIENKNILITGAGGSIGSELCRQIIRLQPKSMILLDISEAALYLIEKELLDLNLDISILTVIGNVTRRKRLDFLLKNYKVEIIYHTAAYKHVPMVEKNMVAGIRCNIIGTLTCIESALHNDVESFVYISTDKAVRPTNVMGATKRFAELLLQAISKKKILDNKANKTRITIVRFGNVLGSSGSVVPLFQKQIEKGGPITVTDPKIIRYFMTITEASQLVIQAGSMGSNGDIFILDMGEPVSVLELARDMISLSGMNVKDDNNPDGDIEITFTGLRPGEKLYEELLIDEKSEKTKHEKIMKANEPYIPYEDMQIYIKELEQAVNNFDQIKMEDIFLATVSGYKSNS
jgi:UDP-N-acetylglucosamine 4,6-dehydratase